MSLAKTLVEMKGITKRFERAVAVRDMDFRVSTGEIVGLIGDNGAGKSTLVKILSGVLEQDEGTIFWKGKKIGKVSSPQHARSLGIETVFQDQALISLRDISQNLFLGRELTKFGFLGVIRKEEMDSISEKVTKKLGLNIPSMKQELRLCSGGEKQGVAIARALLFKAKLVILDEPTRALSIKGVEKVLDFVRKLKKENIACVIISHTLEHIYPVSDRIVAISRGRVIANVKKGETTVGELRNIILTEK